jgi:ribosomal protein L11 methyltransferase
VSWTEVSLAAAAGDVDPACEAMERAGAAAVTVRPHGAPVLEPAPGEQPLAACNTVTGLFPGAASATDLLVTLARALGREAVAGARVVHLDDACWEQAWRQQAVSRCFGSGLWVVPADAPAPPDARALVRLDPGLAFGTGAHPTTALCLSWLASRDLRGRSVVDFGCGSGVLAIAAAALGASDVFAADHDPQALHATRDNAERNGLASRVRITDHPPPCDVLVSNILANALLDLAPRFARLVRPGGELALSGILPQQSQALSARYGRHFRLDAPREHEGWVLLGGRRL